MYTSDTVLFHNGIITTACHNDRSDTQEFILQTFPHTEEWCELESDYSKFALFLRGKLKLLGKWSNIKGIWYSNEYSIAAPTYSGRFSSLGTRKWSYYNSAWHQNDDNEGYDSGFDEDGYYNSDYYKHAAMASEAKAAASGAKATASEAKAAASGAKATASEACWTSRKQSLSLQNSVDHVVQ
jgi:hypothetical protein